MELRLILKMYCISLIKDIFGLHDIVPLLTHRRGRHKVFITRFFARKEAAFMVKLGTHTSCCGSLLKPFRFLESSLRQVKAPSCSEKQEALPQHPVLAGMDGEQRDAGEKKPTVKPLTSLRWNP